MTEGTDILATSRSIVVLGAMNPAIHHPGWYQHVGLLSPSEADQVNQNSLVCIPQLATFDVGDYAVTCQPDRWSVRTSESERAERIRDISAGVFRVLDHTPVSAVGHNIGLHVRLAGLDVARALAASVRLPLGADEDGPLAKVRIGYGRALPEWALEVRIEVSMHGDDALYIGVNAHHDISVRPGEVRHVELAPLIERGSQIVEDYASRETRRVAAHLQE